MAVKDESIATIEIELLTLGRVLETVGRKSSLYVEVDRAGYLALRTLERLGPQPTSALAEALHLDASTVTRQVTTLVTNGFVERRPHPGDRRSTQLAVTPAGRRIMREVERERRRLLHEMFRDWDEQERRLLGRMLTRLNHSLILQLDATAAAEAPAGPGSPDGTAPALRSGSPARTG
jgi:DNA-binding MarR family transcriptional regulator